MGREFNLKIGELAKMTGVSVRTLRYYEEIGLLKPSGRTESGHRLYGAGDAARLQQIGSLKMLGLSLDEIAAFFKRPDFSPLEVVDRHLKELKELLKAQTHLREKLELIKSGLERNGAIEPETFIQAVEMMTMFEKYYTPEQLKEIRERGNALGAAGIKRGEDDWAVLMNEVRAEMNKGTDPSGPVVQALAKRWSGLVEKFTGGNARIADSMNDMYGRELQKGPSSPLASHVPPDMKKLMEYIRRAKAGGRS